MRTQAPVAILSAVVIHFILISCLVCAESKDLFVPWLKGVIMDKNR